MYIHSGVCNSQGLYRWRGGPVSLCHSVTFKRGWALTRVRVSTSLQQPQTRSSHCSACRPAVSRTSGACCSTSAKIPRRLPLTRSLASLLTSSPSLRWGQVYIDVHAFLKSSNDSGPDLWIRDAKTDFILIETLLKECRFPCWVHTSRMWSFCLTEGTSPQLAIQEES